MSQWISVEDRLPENGQTIVGLAVHEPLTVHDLLGNIWLEMWNPKDQLAYMTHWMPLPDPPEEA